MAKKLFRHKSKGTWYYLNHDNIFWFSKKPTKFSVTSFPEGYKIIVSPKTGMLLLKKTGGKR